MPFSGPFRRLWRVFEKNDVFDLVTKMRYRIKCWRPFRRVSNTVKFFMQHIGLRYSIKIFFRMLKEECSKDIFKLRYNRPDDFTICIWQKKRRVSLIWIAYRAFVFAFLFICFWVIFLLPEDGYVWYKNLIYFTYWSLAVEILTFAAVLVITVKKFKAQKKNPQLPPLEVMPVSYKITWCLYNLSMVATIIVSLLFWVFIYSPEKYPNIFVTLPAHVFNSVFLILDFCLNAVPYRLLHIYMALLFSTVYGTFTIIYQTSGGTGNKDEIPIYPILDWRKPVSALSTCGIHIGSIVIVHFGWWLLNSLKQCLRNSMKRDPYSEPV